MKKPSHRSHHNVMKNIIIVGLFAFSSIAALAAPAKTSKAVALTDRQMASIKGQGIITVYVWTEGAYITVFSTDVGFTSSWHTQNIYNGGPLSGIYYTY